MVGTEETRLVVLRGNSASGKSSVADGLRERFGRDLALVGQDNLRRIMLRERDRPGAANIGLIDLTARYALDAGFHVVVEGILYADRYGDMLTELRADHRGPTHGYRSASGAARTGISYGKRASSPTAACRALIRFSASAGPVPSRTNKTRGKSG